MSLNFTQTITFSFRLIPLGKVSTPNPSGYGLNRTAAILLQGWPWHLITHKGWYAIKHITFPGLLNAIKQRGWKLNPIIHITYSSSFHMVYTFQPPKIWWQISVQTGSTLFNLLPFWIATKQIFLWDKNNFCYNSVPNKSRFIFIENNSEEKSFVFAFFKKNPLIELNDTPINKDRKKYEERLKRIVNGY